MWRPRTRTILGPGALLLTLTVSAFARVNLPDWVQSAAAVDPGKLPPETKAVLLLDETDYRVTGPGEYVEHSRTVIKILRPEGREYGDPEVHFRRGEKILSLHCWSMDSSGQAYELKDKDFIETGRFYRFILYSDHMERVAQAPANRAGTVIATEYEVKRREWINELGWTFQGEIPVVRSVFTVELPAGWEYRANWAYGARVEAAQTGPNQWTWTLSNVPGIERNIEPLMPPAYVLFGRMSLAYFGPGLQKPTSASWKQVGEWYSELVAGRASPTPEISEQTQQLIAGKTDFDSKLRVLTQFLQNQIRYVAISIGIGGDQPHPAGDVFRYRYGDCKDKATLLKAMLEVAGIRSDLVIINSDRGFINPAVPSSWGNHVILAIELPKDVPQGKYESVIQAQSGKRYLIFDPTDEHTPAGFLRSDLQSSYALLVTDSGGELIRTPLLPPETNVISRTGHFALTAEGALSGAVSVENGGDFAAEMRSLLHSIDQREREQLISRQIGRSIQGFSLEDVNVEHLDQPQTDLLIQYKLATPLYGQVRGPLMLVRPRVLGDKSAPVEHKPRHYPIELGQTARETDTYEIEIPKGYEIDDLPEPVHIDVGFASYQSKVQVEGSKLRYWREYVVRDLSVPAEKYSEWVRLQGTIGADESAAAVLKRTQ